MNDVTIVFKSDETDGTFATYDGSKPIQTLTKTMELPSLPISGEWITTGLSGRACSLNVIDVSLDISSGGAVYRVYCRPVTGCPSECLADALTKGWCVE